MILPPDKFVKQICIRSIMKSKKLFKKFKLPKKPWWFWVIAAIIAAYVINGIVFAIIIYKTYPSEMPCKTKTVDGQEQKECKKYPYEKNSVVFMTKIYPYPAAWVN